MLFADIEGDGLLDDLTQIWCIAIGDGKDIICYSDQRYYPPLKEGLKRLAEADKVVFHNGLGYDFWAINKLYPGTLRYDQIVDTLVVHRMMWPGTKASLEVIGDRIGCPKGDFNEFSQFSPKMAEYCVQDVEVITKFWTYPFSTGTVEDYYTLYEGAAECEHTVQFVLELQKHHGFRFNAHKAQGLERTLRGEQAAIERQLQGVFPLKVIQRVSEKTGNVLKPKTEEFNPGSRDQIAARLTEKYQWKPTKFTPSGKPQIDEGVLKDLPFPEIKLLVQYLTVIKKLGQLVDGKNGWLKRVTKEGFVHGSVIGVGARTHRMAHFGPNMAQVDKDPRMRELWEADIGQVLVGVDADSLELRMLAHYLAKYDGGAFARAVDQGTKELGTDPHTLTQMAVGFRHRDNAKTLRYAYLYGAGDEKLGKIARADNPDLIGGDRALGKTVRRKLLLGVAGEADLLKVVHKLHNRDGQLPGIDGRPIPSDSEHSALNTLLQSAGGIVMKYALVIFYRVSQAMIGTSRVRLCANVHDEWQLSVDRDLAESVGKMAADCIRVAGEQLNLRCPLKGNYDIGATWRDTH